MFPPIVDKAALDNRVLTTTAERLFSAEGCPLPLGNSFVMVVVDKPCSDVRKPLTERAGKDGRKKPFYEAAEHQDSALLAEIRFSEDEVYSAPEYTLPVKNGLRLRYGEVISLFGDFYGKPGVQIASGERAFIEAFCLFDSADNKKEMQSILQVMKKERAAIDEAQKKGTSVTAAYASIDDELTKGYVRATGGGYYVGLIPHGRYIDLASSNYDHFGADAENAYRVAHRVACREAALASHAVTQEERQDKLSRAYLMNACADHFLTDLFSSGHLRVPRRELHEQITFETVGDLLSKMMHDEDNAKGLNVRNKNGDQWKTFGDKHFHEASENARQIVREAVKASAAEIWVSFATGQEIQEPFAALDLTPIISDALEREDNHSPLFIVDGGVVKVRAKLDDINCRKWTTDFAGVITLARLVL